MSSTQHQNILNEFAAMKAELLAIRAENSEMKVMLKEMAAAPAAEHSAPSKKAKKAKAEPSGEPKEKRALEPGTWIFFSSKQVGPVVRAAEDGLEKKSSVGTINQFAGSLWSQKKEWTEDEIKLAWADFVPPAESKQSIAGKSKRSGSSTGSAEKADPVADEAGAGEKKTRKPQSEETKKAAAAKRAATKAKKAAEAAAPEAEAFEEVAEKAEAAEVVEAPKPKAKAKIAAKPKKVVDLALDAWSHDGTDYLKNERNDVVSMDGEWVGRWNGASIDTTVPEPADFETLTSRD